MTARWLAFLWLLTWGTSVLYGWGREGHALVAGIAERRLNAKARSQVAALLEPGETLASIAAWADEVRPQRPETSTWHYINVPVQTARGDYRPYCPNTGCVVEVVPRMLARLKDPSLSRVERAEALKFAVHFVGDLHQPLHCGDNGDRGGNDVKVVFRDQPTNLHSLWDTPLVLFLLQSSAGKRDEIVRGPGWMSARTMRKGGPEDWVWEAQAASRNIAYGNLSAGEPAVLGEEYARKASPVIELQLQRAGVRLAALLNATLGR